MIDYELIRTKRRTIAIRITKDARVQVRAPLKLERSEIDRVVATKVKWINDHLQKRKNTLTNQEAFRLNYGDTIFLQGKLYPILAGKGIRSHFDGQAFTISPNLSTDQIKYTIIRLYRKIAKKLLADKVSEYSKKTGLVPVAVRINAAKTRWGSCSGKNSLNFSWKLIMAEDEVIDYVVVHELAHIKEHNHSKRFWTIVASILPDYKMREVKLKQFQKRLVNENWDEPITK